jgi:hypothetical protein
MASLDNVGTAGLYSRIISLIDTVGSGFDRLIPHPVHTKNVNI